MVTSSQYKIKKLTSSVTLKVTITREFRVRRWLALNLIKLAVWIMGIGLEVKDKEGGE